MKPRKPCLIVLVYIPGIGRNILARNEDIFFCVVQFQMSKENLTESGFEPETSGLTYQRSTN